MDYFKKPVYQYQHKREEWWEGPIYLSSADKHKKGKVTWCLLPCSPPYPQSGGQAILCPLDGWL